MTWTIPDTKTETEPFLAMLYHCTLIVKLIVNSWFHREIYMTSLNRMQTRNGTVCEEMPPTPREDMYIKEKKRQDLII